MTQDAQAIIQQAEATVVLDGPLLKQVADLDAAYLKLFPSGTAPIATDEQNAEAQVLQASYNDLAKEVEKKKKEACEPYNAALKRIREAVAPTVELIETRLGQLVPALRAYFQKKEREAREAQEKLNRQTEQANARAAANAQKKGAEPPPPKVAPTIQAPAKTVDLGGVKQTMKDNWVLHINGMTDEDAKKLRRSDPRSKGIPDSLFIFDWATASAQARGSKGVNPYEGTPIVFENDQVPSNRK